METIHWELTVLSKAIAFPNLSTAAVHVRLSQPQLSRIIQKIERELGVNLLDRSSKRKASWTPLARQIAESVDRSNRGLSESLQRVLQERSLANLRVGTLEGLARVASRIAADALEVFPTLTEVDIEVLDLGFLEESFLRGNYDLLFTSREPGARKFSRLAQIGYQSLEARNGESSLQVLSPFEAGRLRQPRKARSPSINGEPQTKKIVSNALDVRRFWVEELGASGWVPSELFKKKRPGKLEGVYVIGSDHLAIRDWERLKKLFGEV